ncbi:RraA family protein [Kineococcus endophyticus]|uniref:Putative 4-hydroxy-4-methyl-2-oxoglutarate aldolase n=1 Tax=Kineococcus endophyticus TaxID=1181883 RepID=A0ABV3PCZ7_9ACTN
MSTSTSAIPEATTTSTATSADAARGHSAATLWEAAATQWRTTGGDIPPEVAMDAGITAAWPGARVAGPAYTVQGAGGDNLALHLALVAAPAGSVLVAELGGADNGHWGEVMAVAAQAHNLLGLVIDGGVRDRAEQAALGFPVFSRGGSVRGTRKDVPGHLAGPVRVGGLLIRTGDLVVADADGVVVLPAERVDAVLHTADERATKEQDIFTQLKAGATTLQVYGLNPRGAL